MNAYDMLCKVIQFNREMMATARTEFEQYLPGDARFELAYQIYRDAEDAYDNAKRMARYGVGNLDAPKSE